MSRRLPPFPRALFALGVAGQLAALLLLALALAGCRQETMQLGDLRVTQIAVLSTNTLHVTCAEYYPDGRPSSSATVDNSGTGDTATIHELLTGVGAIIGAGAKTAAKSAGAPLRDQGLLSSSGSNAAACVGEHFRGESAPFPPPPPQPPQQQSTPHDHGDLPAMLESPEP